MMNGKDRAVMIDSLILHIKQTAKDKDERKGLGCNDRLINSIWEQVSGIRFTP